MVWTKSKGFSKSNIDLAGSILINEKSSAEEKEKALEVYKPKNDLSVTKKLFETAFLLKCDPCISDDRATENINIIKDILIQFLK